MIGVACPLCLSLDAVNIALFGAAVAIVRSLNVAAPPGWTPTRFWIPTAAAIGALVVVLVFIQMPKSGSTQVMSVDEIREKDPRFYAWYISQPVIDLQLDEKDRAIRLSEPFMKEVIANLDNDWTMTSDQIDAFLQREERRGA